MANSAARTIGRFRPIAAIRQAAKPTYWTFGFSGFPVIYLGQGVARARVCPRRRSQTSGRARWATGSATHVDPPHYIPINHRTALLCALFRLSISELPSPSQNLRRSPDNAKPEDTVFRRYSSSHVNSLGYLSVTPLRRSPALRAFIRNLLHRAAFETPIASETSTSAWHNPTSDGCSPPMNNLLPVCRSFSRVRSPVNCCRMSSARLSLGIR